MVVNDNAGQQTNRVAHASIAIRLAPTGEMRFVSDTKNSLQRLFFYAYAFWRLHAKRTRPMTDWPLAQSYRFNGHSVRYAVRGDGPPLVFVHGTPFSSYV